MMIDPELTPIPRDRALQLRFALVMTALMMVLPFLVWHHRQPIPSFAGEWLAVALGLLAALPLLLRYVWQPAHIPGIVLVPLGLMAVLGVQVAVGLAVYWQQHMLAALYLGWAALMMIVGAMLRHRMGLMRIAPVLAWATLAGGVLSAAIVALQAAGLDSLPFIVPARKNAYAANLSQVNHLANYLALALGSLMYLRMTSLIRVSLFWLFAFLLLLPLALTGARMGWIYVAGLALGAWLAGRRGAQGERLGGQAAMLWLIPLFVLAQFVIPLLSIANAPMMPGEKVVAGLQGESVRMQLLEVAGRVFLAHPWLGAGFGQLAWQDFMLAETVRHNAGMASHAHNLFAHLLAETGLIGMLVVLAGCALWLWRALRAPLTAERFWLLALLGVLFAHSLLEYPLWYAFFLGIAALLLGLGNEKSSELRMDLGPVAALGVLAFGALSLANLHGSADRLEHWFNEGKQGRLQGAQLERFADEIGRLRGQSLLAPYADAATAIVLQIDRQDIEAKIAVTQQAMRFTPTASLAYKEAALLALNGQRGKALAQLHRALARHPQLAEKFRQELVRQVLRGEIRLLPLLMVVQQQVDMRVRKTAHESGNFPEGIREKPPKPIYA